MSTRQRSKATLGKGSGGVGRSLSRVRRHAESKAVAAPETPLLLVSFSQIRAQRR